MTDWTNLPSSTTPAEFNKLVEDAVAGQPAPPNASSDKAVFTITGDGGGQWSMGFEDGRLQFQEGTADNPPLAIDLTIGAWRAFMVGSVRDAIKSQVDTIVIDPSKIGNLYKNADKVEVLKTIEGSVQLVVTADDGPHVVTITTGGSTPNLESPTAKVTVSLADLVELAASDEDPQSKLTTAFFMGKFQVEGDLNHLMAMAMQLQ